MADNSLLKAERQRANDNARKLHHATARVEDLTEQLREARAMNERAIALYEQWGPWDDDRGKVADQMYRALQGYDD